MGDAAKIHPVLVVFALIAGEHSYGLVGALFAVPGGVDHPDDLRLLPAPPPQAPRRSAPLPPRRDGCRRRRAILSYSDEIIGCRSAPTISAERSGMSIQPGRVTRRRGWLRRPPRAAPRAGSRPLRCARRCDRWRRGRRAVGDALDVKVAHRVRAAGRDEAAAVGRGQRDLQRRRADETSRRSTNARLLRSATCTAVGGGVG